MEESRIVITSNIHPEKFIHPAAYTTASPVSKNIFTECEKIYTCGISLVITQALNRSFPTCDFILMDSDDKIDIRTDRVYLAVFEQVPIKNSKTNPLDYRLRLAPNHWNTYMTSVRLYSLRFLPCKEEVDVH